MKRILFLGIIITAGFCHDGDGVKPLFDGFLIGR